VACAEDAAEAEQKNEDDRQDDRERLVLLVPGEEPVLFIGLGAGKNDDQVDQVPEPQSATRDELQDAGTDLAKVEPVDAEVAEQEAEEPGRDETLLWRGGGGQVRLSRRCGVTGRRQA
jgi:hypothetical protein